jgi:hypothetical protein
MFVPLSFSMPTDIAKPATQLHGSCERVLIFWHLNRDAHRA